MKRRNPWVWVPSLNFAKGLPYVTLTVLSLILYKQMGLSNGEITFYVSWFYLPWVLKPLWSPFLRVWKSRRWWVVAMQLLIGTAYSGVAFAIPSEGWLQATLFCFWAMAFACSAHNVAVDSIFFTELDEQHRRNFRGIRSAFYRIAYVFGQGVLVMIAGNLQVVYRNDIGYSWSLVFYATAGIILAIWLSSIYLLYTARHDEHIHDLTVAEAWGSVKQSFRKFLNTRDVMLTVCFLLFYTMPEGLLSKVATLFLIDASHNGGLGLSPQEYGLVQGTLGVIGLMFGSLTGRKIIQRSPLHRWLWPMALTMTLPNLVYIYLSYLLPDSLLVVNFCVFIEQFGYGFGLIVYLTFITQSKQGNAEFGHNAICKSLVAASMMLPGLVSGTLQESLGYRGFFILVVVFSLVTLAVTAWLHRSGFGKEDDRGY